MSLDKIKDFFGDFGKRDLPTVAAVLVGLLLLYLIFRTGKSFAKLLVFLLAIALFAGAWWWHNHK